MSDPSQNGKVPKSAVPSTDPVGEAPGEPVALRRMREAKALAQRLKDEAARERAGGQEASRW